MPFIHIRSLPPLPEVDLSTAVGAISREFADVTGTDLGDLTVTWSILAPERYAHAGRTAATQPTGSHPALAEVFAPDLHTPERRAQMLEAAAAAVARHARIPIENVFVDFRPARAGEVFDGGRIVSWNEAGQPRQAGRSRVAAGCVSPR